MPTGIAGIADPPRAGRAVSVVPALPRRAPVRPAAPAALAAELERAATAIGRLDAALRGHPLTSAWTWRSRLEAVRLQAAADGLVIDPWHLAALAEGVRFRLGGEAASLAERGAVLQAARHALGLWRWLSRPDRAQRKAIAAAAAAFPRSGGSALLSAAETVHSWLDGGGTRPPLRAALVGHWHRRGLLCIPDAALLTGARALGGEVPWGLDAWTPHFLAAVAEEADAGRAMLYRLERQWFDARAAVRGRRRDSHAAFAIDILAAAPLISATSLAGGLGIAVKNAAALLADFAGEGIAIEVTRRAKRRLYGLTHLAPLRTETLAPRRPWPGRRRGRPHEGAASGVVPESDPPPELSFGAAATRALSALERRDFECSDLDRWMREAELAIVRTAAVLDRRVGAPSVPDAGAKTPPLTPETELLPGACSGEDCADDAAWNEPLSDK